MTKRICPSCGLGAYSADTVTTWICEACNTEMPPSCAVEMERCKPESEIERAIEILAQMRIALGRGTAKISTTTALAVALVALREKQEREKGCEYCNMINPTTDTNYGAKLGLDDKNDWIVIETNGFDYAITSNSFEFEITHCPRCGRNLKEAQNGQA